MTLLLLGASHRTAPFSLLERLVLDAEAADKLAQDLVQRESVTEAIVISTCNRVEVYAEAERFHPAVADAVELLARYSGTDPDVLQGASYVYHEDRAVEHLFTVACGLDSLAVGESQILGQVRAALRRATEAGTLGPVLSAAGNAALRLGKRAHTETALDGAAPSLVEAGLEQARSVLGGELADASAVVLGAGSMASLAMAGLHREGVGRIVVASRRREAAERLAGDPAAGRDLEDLPAALSEADLVVSCTGAPAAVVTRPMAAAAARGRAGRPQVYLDLALPRDVAPDVSFVPAVTVVDLHTLATTGAGSPTAPEAVTELDAVRRFVAEEVAGFAAWRRERVAVPTVSALRAWAGEVVEAELGRLAGRTPEMAEQTRAEVARTVQRVVDKLLHRPTVHLRKSVAETGPPYADVVRTLFDLDVQAVAAMSRPVDLTRDGLA